MASKGKGARNKGSTFERKIAKSLSEWTGFVITRTPMSGGFYKSGDLTPKEPEEQIRWPFSVELKNTEAWNIKQLFQIKSEEDMPKCFAKWWAQCTDDASQHDKKPALIFTQNFKPEFIMFRERDYGALFTPLKQCTYISCGELRVMLLEDFLSIPYASFISLELSR
jgi:hypothetical protein